MTRYQSKKWRLFTSRPTSVLKRDFMKWTYLSVGKIDGFKLTKDLAIGNDKEMDVFIDCEEYRKNYALIAAQYEREEIEKVLNFYREKILRYKPKGKGDVERSLNAMKEIGPVLIYSYYVEGFLEPKRTEEAAKMLLALNAFVRDGGRVTGTVKIVQGLQDMKNCVGKIVVSRDTIIEYTPMLKKNLAIVTDLGGISCHAVVTAREFKIPCVVGTKYATEVFRDGDKVLVDADIGIVKILKRS